MTFDDYRSGFVAIIGRPNVGKSTLINSLVGKKISIVSTKPNTTRTAIRGIISGDGYQVVLVDTPGIHKPRSRLGARLNNTATDAMSDVDLAVVVVDASASMGPGDERVLASAPPGSFIVLNKVDRASKSAIMDRLLRLSSYNMEEYFPISAKTLEGVDELREAIVAKMPSGPPYYPPGVVSDTTETEWIAELVREALLEILREELPHSLATMVTEVEESYIRCEIFVERDSQKGIVVGHRGSNLKEVGILVRKSLPPKMYLELVVKVAKDWQSQNRYLDEFGL
ncbi:GTPase Era [Acidithrix ferrooxidans]|jgi:GTP-binding protein Era|uniref:GTPase Era n=1 Tax=Acidithrix ferrooxidans TaxID=1280514 RepID=A0A0D8HHF9_9ACTN|nr:GTPase Era [Acidithrix ferrooxidans]KJF16506.1 GTPase Era [Acidithrix ferrooxidans]